GGALRLKRRSGRLSGQSDALLPDLPRAHRAHPGALVEACRARRVRRVDAELDPRDAAPTELGERRQEQREPDAAAAPRASDAEEPDLAGVFVLHRAVGARGDADDLVALERDEPERRVEPRALALDLVVDPPLERGELAPPVVLEGLAERLVPRALVALTVEGADRDPLVEHRRRRRLVEID